MKKFLLTMFTVVLVLSFALLSACSRNLNDGTSSIWNIETAYAQAQDLGYNGSLQEFIDSIHGEKGDTGAKGEKGDDGISVTRVYINAHGYLIVELSEGEPVNCGSVLATVPEHEHVLSDWLTDTPATCEDRGLKHKECTDCDAILEIASIERTGHTLGNWEYNTEQHWKELTCGCDGVEKTEHELENGACECGYNELQTALEYTLSLDDENAKVNYVYTGYDYSFGQHDALNETHYVNNGKIRAEFDGRVAYKERGEQFDYFYAECNGELVRTERQKMEYGFYDLVYLAYVLSTDTQYTFNSLGNGQYLFDGCEILLKITQGKITEIWQFEVLVATVEYGTAPNIQLPMEFVDLDEHTCNDWVIDENSHRKEQSHDSLLVVGSAGSHQYGNDGKCTVCGYGDILSVLNGIVELHEGEEEINYTLTWAWDEFIGEDTEIHYVNRDRVCIVDNGITYYQELQGETAYRYAECNWEMVRTEMFEGFAIYDLVDLVGEVLCLAEEEGLKLEYNQEGYYSLSYYEEGQLIEELMRLYLQNGKLVKVHAIGDCILTITYRTAPQVNIPTSYIDISEHTCYDWTIDANRHRRTYFCNGGKIEQSGIHEYWTPDGKCSTCGHDSRELLGTVLEDAILYSPFCTENYSITIQTCTLLENYMESWAQVGQVVNDGNLYMYVPEGEHSYYVEKTSGGYREYTYDIAQSGYVITQTDDVAEIKINIISLSELVNGINAEDFSYDYTVPQLGAFFEYRTEQTNYRIWLDAEGHINNGSKIKRIFINDNATNVAQVYDITYTDQDIQLPALS